MEVSVRDVVIISVVGTILLLLITQGISWLLWEVCRKCGNKTKKPSRSKDRSFSVISEIQPYGELPDIAINTNTRISQEMSPGGYEMAAYATSADIPPQGKDNIYGKENQPGENVYCKEQLVKPEENAYCLEQKVSSEGGSNQGDRGVNASSGKTDITDNQRVKWAANSMYGDNRKVVIPTTGEVVEYAAPDLSQKKNRRDKSLSKSGDMVKEEDIRHSSPSVIV